MAKMTTEEFIARAKQVHGDKYDYSKVQVNGVDNKVCIICPQHGEFWQRPYSHLKGSGCKKCVNPNYGMNTNEFIAKAKQVHSNKYDYSKVEYKNINTKVCIICPEHGEFWQTPYEHLQGKGCAKCSMPNIKMTTEEFIVKAKEVHGDKYDYSKVEYTNVTTKVCIICPEHGEFWQTPQNHLYGNGCKKCKANENADKNRLTTSDFITRAKQIHGDRYDYSKVEYKGSSIPVVVICPEHGEFLTVPANHWKGVGCPKCANKNITTEEFITRAKQIHGDKYDYSKVNYVNSLKKVCIICPEHGEFFMTPKDHLRGNGCVKCSKPNANMTTEEFIAKAKQVHGDKYDYSKVEYVSSKDDVCIICPKHGEFWKNPISHLNGSGCLKCIKPNANMTTEEFIAKAKEIHGDKYDYSKVEYFGTRKDICIICPKHGEFWQTPQNHLYGNGCPICNRGYSKQYKFNLLEEFENEYAFRAFLEDNIDILPLILTNIEPKYEPIKRDIERALAHASETNPIQSLREKYSSDADESDATDDDELIYDIDTDDTVDNVVDWDDDDIVNEMISKELQSDNDNEEELSIDDIIRKNNNYEDEIRVLNRLDSEHLIAPEVREGIMSKILNNKTRAWMAKRDNK